MEITSGCVNGIARPATANHRQLPASQVDKIANNANSPLSENPAQLECIILYKLTDIGKTAVLYHTYAQRICHVQL